ncbi:CUB and sushi domain-containing protein 1-like [Branchiostoma lanceolatum]|uniref:CUB and sushi domain-containing protein 1-like n=1 Tax=Branchiostoma lanceolatum TaxID=7740 RepID=UPI00345279B6
MTMEDMEDTTTSDTMIIAIPDPTATPACGGYLTAPPGGTMTSPNYPSNYPNSANCEWTITVPEGSTVRLTFDSFNTEGTWDVLTINDGHSSSHSLLQSLSGGGLVYPVTSTSNNMFLRFTSDASVADTGFQCSFSSDGCWEDEFRCSDGSCYPTTFRCDGVPHCLSEEDEVDCGDDGGASSCTDTSEHCASWASAGECDTNPDYMLVQCAQSCGNCGGSGGTDGENDGAGRPCSGSQLKCSDGTCIDKSTDVCDGVNDCTDGFDEQQCWIPDGGCLIGDGASYSGTVSVTETGQTCQHWDSQTPHAHDFTPANYPSSGLQQNHCRNPDGEARVWCYTTDPGERWGYCDVPGCPGTPTSASACGGTLTASEGTVTSPNYPSDYGNNEYCEWTIAAPEGSTVRLTFDSFNLENGWDFLNIYDGDSDTASLIWSLTGDMSGIPGHIISTSNIILVRFTSDGSTTAQGFEFSFTDGGCWDNEFRCSEGSCLPTAWRCDGTPHCLNGEDEEDCGDDGGGCSPGDAVCDDGSSCYPVEGVCDSVVDCSDGSDEANFCLLFTGPPCSGTQLKCLDGTCIDKSTDVCDGENDCMDGVDEQQCWIPEDVTPTGSSECGGILAASDEGTVTSPNYPSDYGNNENCEWTITAPEGSTVRLTFDSFNLENGWDVLNIYDGDSDTASLIWR